MGEIVVIGGGLIGLTSGLLLARDGHRVTVLERDPQPPPAPDGAWERWERRGVNQFRLLHGFLPRFRQVLDTELPDVAAALLDHGAHRANRIVDVVGRLGGEVQPGDERFDAVTGRRPMVEAVLAGVAEREPGLTLRRGVAVRGLVADPATVPATIPATAPGRAGGPVPHVAGVALEEGEVVPADLVVDASGRRSPLAGWLEAMGARRPRDDVEDVGFVYYARHFCSPDGSLPEARTTPLQPYESVSIVTLPAEGGTWGLGIVGSARDTALRGLRDPDRWDRVVRHYPLVAHWTEAEPITAVDVMAKIPDRLRHFTVEGTSVATGVVAVGDAWGCTNPSVGRGASIGALQATCLRDLLRAVPTSERLALVQRWEELTEAVVAPFYRDTRAFDRHRLAQIEAQMAGVPYETDDPGWTFGQALAYGARSDPELLRAFASVACVLERGVDVLARPSVMAKVRALGPPEPLPGPSRAELLGLVA